MEDSIEFQLVGGDIFIDPSDNTLCVESGGRTIVFRSILQLDGIDMWFTEPNVEGWRYEESVN